MVWLCSFESFPRIEYLGHSLERMIKDRVLRELVGGVNNVTIGDVKAKELGKDKKTVLERVDDSCFDVIVEMAGQTRWRIHYNANKAVDAILKGKHITQYVYLTVSLNI